MEPWVMGGHPIDQVNRVTQQFVLWIQVMMNIRYISEPRIIEALSQKEVWFACVRATKSSQEAGRCFKEL